MNPTATPNAAPAQPAGPLAPFMRGSRHHTEIIAQETGIPLDTEIEVGNFNVNAFGFLRSIIIEAEISGGTGTAALLQPDAPWSLFHSISLQDVSGGPLVNLSGYSLYLFNKWGGFQGKSDLAQAPGFTQLSTAGNGKMQIRVPVEFSARDALGCLPNQNAASTYKLRINQAAKSKVYSTVPSGGTLVVSYKIIGEYWSQPGAVTADGLPVAQNPPCVGITSYGTFLMEDVQTGTNRFNLDRVGNYIRSLTLIGRTAAGARSDAVLPTMVDLQLDGKSLLRHPASVQRQHMWERSGMTPDTGVWVIDYTSDLDGLIGNEMRNLWLPTSQASRLEFTGDIATAGTIEIIVNDVAIPEGGGSPFVGGA